MTLLTWGLESCTIFSLSFLHRSAVLKIKQKLKTDLWRISNPDKKSYTGSQNLKQKFTILNS